jgi:hypothetical protein
MGWLPRRAHQVLLLQSNGTKIVFTASHSIPYDAQSATGQSFLRAFLLQLTRMAYTPTDLAGTLVNQREQQIARARIEVHCG